MAYYDGDINEDLLVEIPCEFCNDLFPLLFLTEHQTGCRYDLVRVTEPNIAEIEDEFASQELKNKENKNDYDQILHQILRRPKSKNTTQPNKDIKESPVKNSLDLFDPFLEEPESKSTSSPNERIKKSSIQKSFNLFECYDDLFLEATEEKKTYVPKDNIKKRSDVKRYNFLDRLDLFLERPELKNTSLANENKKESEVKKIPKFLGQIDQFLERPESKKTSLPNEMKKENSVIKRSTFLDLHDRFLETPESKNNTSLSNGNVRESPVKERSSLFERFLHFMQPKDSSPKEALVAKESPKKNKAEKDFHEYEVLEEDLLEEYETFGSAKNKEKRVEETPNFKVPNIPILNNNDSKCFNSNVLPDSDNEETESLEQFWEKAKIILAQRARAMEEKKILKN